MSDARLRAMGLALAAAGLAISAYLTWTHYSGTAPVCSISHGCEVVQHSRWATLAGVPVALLGVLGYAAIATCLLLRAEGARLAAAALTLCGLLFSGWLTWLEVARIHALCQWCLSSAVVMLVLTAVTWVRAGASPSPPAPAPRDRRASAPGPRSPAASAAHRAAPGRARVARRSRRRPTGCS